jgi:hypothetical protein
MLLLSVFEFGVVMYSTKGSFVPWMTMYYSMLEA